MSHRYLLFYKPFDVLCQFTNPDRLACRTLADFIDVPEVYSVGRLDRDSEGLLLLTDHGSLKHRLCHPDFGHQRTYWVQVEGIPTDDAIDQLRQGVQVQNYRTRPAQVDRLLEEPDLAPRVPPIRERKAIPTTWLALTLTEGRNRQVRRMTAAVGFPTLRLVRAAIGGGLTLAGLEPGQWRDITAAEQLELQHLLIGSGSGSGSAGSGSDSSAPQFNPGSTSRPTGRSTRPTSYRSGPRRHP
jgi:23S rRNA pseudouridine2457 synthase